MKKSTHPEKGIVEAATIVEPPSSLQDPDVDVPETVEAATTPDLAWEKWSPDGHATFNRVADENFAPDSVWQEAFLFNAHGTPEHRVARRTLPDGRTVTRPFTYLGHDEVSA